MQLHLLFKAYNANPDNPPIPEDRAQALRALDSLLDEPVDSSVSISALRYLNVLHLGRELSGATDPNDTCPTNQDAFELYLFLSENEEFVEGIGEVAYEGLKNYLQTKRLIKTD